MRYFLAIFISLLFSANISFAKDDQSLFKKLTKIAEAGNPEAQYHLGMLYNNGIGTEKDISKAFYWFEKSASKGDPLGHYKVGCYYSGQGEGIIALDEKIALKHKLIAAENGYFRAQSDVALIYYRNNDMNKAISWWKKSANQGDPDSVKALFSLYYSGTDVPKDAVKAYGYLKIIERNIGEENKSKLQPQFEILKNELSPAQITEAANYANNWSPQKTPLTLKALEGKKEIWRIIDNAKEKNNNPINLE